MRSLWGLLALMLLLQAPGLSTPSFIVTTPITYYVCAKAAGGTCVYAADGGTVATPSDDNGCLTKALPCRTDAGVRSRLRTPDGAPKIIAAVVTIQHATTAGTGSDLYRPNGTVFDNKVVSDEPDTTIYLQEQGNSLGSYPSAYLWYKGDDATPSNVLVCGSATCSSGSPTDARGVVFTGTTVRISGVQGEYFISSPSAAAFYLIRSTAYVENNAFVGTGATNDQESLTYPVDHAILKFGGTLTLTNGAAFNSSNWAQINFRTPAGRLAATTSVSNTLGNPLFQANEHSYLAVDALSLTATGAGAHTIFRAQNGSTIYWNDDSTFTAPTQTIRVNGANITMYEALDRSYVSDACRVIGSLDCLVGNTTSIARYIKANNGSYVRYITAPTGATNADAITGGDGVTIDGPTGPTVASTSANSCGTTAPSMISGSRTHAWAFTVGATSGSDCTVTFPAAAPTFWSCGVSNETTANLVRWVRLTTTTGKVLGTMLAGDVITGTCEY